MNPVEALTEANAFFLESALAKGFAPPMLLAAVSVNGSMFFYRYTPANGENADGGFDNTILAQHIDGQGFKPPINVLLTDSTGQAARMLIGGATEPEFFWPSNVSSHCE